MKKQIKLKLAGTVLISAVLSGLCMSIISLFMIYASKNLEFAIFFNQNIFLFMLIYLLAFTVFFFIFFMILINKHITYLKTITTHLKKIDNKNLNVAIPIKTEDEIGQMALTINQMSERLDKAFEKEKQFEKEKSDLITNMSHDLRTPLTSIIGYLGLARKESVHNTETSKYLDIIDDKCLVLKTSIDKLFEYSKLQNSDIIINKTDINLSELIEQAVLDFIPAFKEADMVYNLDFLKEKLTVNIDAVLMSRVISNLVSNAILHGKEGKKLDIKTFKVSDSVVVQFTNYGDAIPQDKLPHIFNRYYTGDYNNGSGIGLAIVKRIVDLHSGTVNVTSDENRTVFEIRLKLAK